MDRDVRTLSKVGAPWNLDNADFIKELAMKGMIFTEFFDMVSETFSPEMVEIVIEKSDLPNQGAYTDVGTYDYQELLRLVTNLSKESGMSIEALESAYGRYLFKKFLKRYPSLITSCRSSFEFLRQVHDHIHVEVLKLYPDAELPSFECEMSGPKKMTMKYRSNHPFSHLAHGLILGCADHFNEKIKVEMVDLPATNKKINVLFTLSKEE
jgi:hypothetical protein